MDEKRSVIYFYGDKCEKMQPVETSAKERELPDRYMLQYPGLYRFGGKLWNIEKEGLYRFPADEERMYNYCYYEKDNFALVSALFHSARFEEVTEPVEHIELLLAYLTKRIETNLPMIKLLFTFLNGMRIAVRQVALYSPVIGNSVFDWLEVWSEEKNTWELYWVDKGAYLGSVDKNRTCFDAFDELCHKDIIEKQIIPIRQMKNELLENAGILDEVNAALENHELFAGLVEKYKIFPVIRSEGKNSLCINSSKTYCENMTEKISSIAVGGDDTPLYNLCFHDEDYIKEHIYGKQIYIVTYNAVRIG